MCGKQTVRDKEICAGDVFGVQALRFNSDVGRMD
jgi:hypothetical protein